MTGTANKYLNNNSISRKRSKDEMVLDNENLTKKDPFAFTDEGFQDLLRPCQKLNQERLTNSLGHIIQYKNSLHKEYCSNNYSLESHQVIMLHSQEEKIMEEELVDSSSLSSTIIRTISPPSTENFNRRPLKRVKSQHQLLFNLGHSTEKLNADNVTSSCASSSNSKTRIPRWNWGQYVDIETTSQLSKRPRFVC